MNDYITQSIYSDPGIFLNQYHVFPRDINFIRQCLHHLFLHYADLSLFCIEIDSKKYLEMNEHYLSNILKRIFDYNKQSLCVPRNTQDRVMGICRDSSLLLCSILRYFGIPARLRSGYVTYFIPGLYLDGLVVEYYDEKQKRWRFVDTRTSQKQIDHYGLIIDFDLTDLPPDKFITAAMAWQLCTSGAADPTRFGSRQFRGLTIVRNRLIQDLALLNKQELLVWDIWGEMLSPIENNRALIHSLSDLLIHNDETLSDINTFYQNNNLLAVPEKVLVDSPFCEPYWHTL